MTVQLSVAVLPPPVAVNRYVSVAPGFQVWEPLRGIVPVTPGLGEMETLLALLLLQLKVALSPASTV